MKPERPGRSGKPRKPRPKKKLRLTVPFGDLVRVADLRPAQARVLLLSGALWIQERDGRHRVVLHCRRKQQKAQRDVLAGLDFQAIVRGSAPEKDEAERQLGLSESSAGVGDATLDTSGPSVNLDASGEGQPVVHILKSVRPGVNPEGATIVVQPVPGQAEGGGA